MAPIIKLIKEKDWETLKRVSPYFYSLIRDLAVTPSGCVLYDNRLMVPAALKQLVINTLHQTHPGQTGMLRLADLVWFPRIHRDVTAKAQSCTDCIKKGKNLKPLIPKQSLGMLPKLKEPNEEVQIDFAGPIPFRGHKHNYYTLISVNRLTRYPHAQVFKGCDTQTALNYLEEYCRFHGIPRSLRCDQAQAFKAREFEIFCKNKNIRLILAPAGDHRATGIVERLIQTIKRRIAVMEHDPLWSSSDLATIVAKIIESIRIILNTTTKLKPFEAHFGRPPNTELSNIITRPSKIPPLPARKPMQRGPYQRPQGQNSQLKVRQIQERLITEEKQEDEEVESFDPESALYIKELSEDWADINHIAPEIFSEVKNTQLNTSLTKEIWVETVTANNLKIQWLVDTESPRTFVSKEQANTIMANNPKIQLQPYKSQTKYKCFNNNNIKIERELTLTLCSGSWTEEHCRILVVGHKTNNLMGRDVLQKLGITLQQQQCKSPGNKIHAINSIETENNIIKWIYNKYPIFAQDSENQKITSQSQSSNEIKTQYNKKDAESHYIY